MYETTITTHFSAAHQLRDYQGKYENLHGHNWTATITVFAKEVDEMGVGMDFILLKQKTDAILSKLDYQNINEVPPFDTLNPSAENIARWVFDELNKEIKTGDIWVRRVEVRETEHCGGAYFE